MRKGYDFLKSLLFLLWVGNAKLMHAYLKRKQTLKKIYRVALMFPILPSHRHLKGKQCNISVYIPPDVCAYKIGIFSYIKMCT